MSQSQGNKSIVNRRHFLLSLLAIPSSYAFADLKKDHSKKLSDLSPIANLPSLTKDPTIIEPHFFIRIKLDGGWDTSLCFDPWVEDERPSEKDMFIEYRQDDVVKVHDLYMGPAAHGLIPHAQDILVINGIFMSKFDQGHPAGISYIDTGSNRGNYPSFTVQLSENTRTGPYGIITNKGLTLNDSKISYIAIEALLMRSQVMIDPYLEELVKKSSESDLVKAQKHLVENKLISQKLLFHLDQQEKKYHQLNDFHVIASSFLSGASLQADLTWGMGLDTHSNHPKYHKEWLAKYLNKISEGIKIFKEIPYGQHGQSLYDVTTFFITSEFSRIPWLNSANGKDHNTLCNSAILIGKGVKGGRVIGSSKLITGMYSESTNAYQIASPIDFETGEIVENSSDSSGFIYPENLLRTVSSIFESKTSYFDNKYQGFKIIPGV